MKSLPLQNQHMQHQLAMFFRDELISWSWRRPPGMPNAPAAGGISSAELKQKVTVNVEHVMSRIKGIAPQCFPEEVCGITHHALIGIFKFTVAFAAVLSKARSLMVRLGLGIVYIGSSEDFDCLLLCIIMKSVNVLGDERGHRRQEKQREEGFDAGVVLERNSLPDMCSFPSWISPAGRELRRTPAIGSTRSNRTC